jgi:hypothetical protein
MYESAQRNELMLVEGGICRYHLCKAKSKRGQVTIHEIIVLPGAQRNGVATNMLRRLTLIPNATSIFAKCPIALEANEWYRAKGFVLEGVETTKTGTMVNKWRLNLLS